ncbi:DUF6778 family protein [Rhodophyticola porphyridii]|uniref:ABC-type transport auxiliary lipoprotein component domain-containing protein n=1 Tax=Rhodophyticola porphyridii TaxID=1852017 RepID=A0A3L9Y4C5_9RHOB|nr:DUF6778 family protein [Rhodophyticola porphyridii]RMA43182.1 hypothetical protein D9R08_06035 [Rhodophyticola porphyridii]
MKRLISLAILGTVLAVSACSAPGTVTRNAPLEFGSAQSAPSSVASLAQDWRVEGLVVDVPTSLTVSEANTIKPRADIVWREDPIGNRHQQVADVMTPPLRQALARLDGDVPVQVRLVMTRFHALTDRTRYSNLRGEHEIEFDLVVRHAETGAVLYGPTHVDVTFPALVGPDAVAAERDGIFQRDRIQARLRSWAGEAFGGDPMLVAGLN